MALSFIEFAVAPGGDDARAGEILSELGAGGSGIPGQWTLRSTEAPSAAVPRVMERLDEIDDGWRAHIDVRTPAVP